MKYMIKVLVGSEGYKRAVYVAKETARTWDGSWYTNVPQQIKTWKTKAGAERWIAQREAIKKMNPVIEETI